MKKVLLFSVLSLIGFIKSVFSQKIIFGKVTSKKDNSPVKGVKVFIPNDVDISTYTDENGNYILKVFDDADVAIFSNYYFDDDTVQITDNEINLAMTPKEIMYVNYTNYYNTYNYYSDYSNYYNYSTNSYYSNYYNYSYSDYSNYYNYSTNSYSNYYNYYDSYYSDYYSVSNRNLATGAVATEEITSGKLTAGEVNDFTKWEMWQDISKGELYKYQNIWQFQTESRFCVQTVNSDNTPVIDAEVELFNNDSLIWTSKTDNTGKAELWGNMFLEIENKKSEYKLIVNYNNKEYNIKNPKVFSAGINILNIDAKCEMPQNIDIAFVIDKTGSMADEIDYLKVEVIDILDSIKSDNKNMNLNFASAIYAIYDYPIAKSDFSDDITDVQKFIKLQQMHDGGDENVDEAIGFGVNNLTWSENSLARIMFLILDEPCSVAPEHLANLKKVVTDASRKGIRIVPVVCSGTDKSLEFIMRSIALATNGTYLFLTDDSGIGNSHIAPSTDKYQVETLNDLIIRIINQFSEVQSCNKEIEYNQKEISDTCLVVIDENVDISEIEINTDITEPDIEDTETDIIEPENRSIKIYPNPTNGNLTIEMNGKLEELFLADYSGKILERYIIDGEEKLNINIAQYPSGFYLLQYSYKDEWKSGRIILVH